MNEIKIFLLPVIEDNKLKLGFVLNKDKKFALSIYHPEEGFKVYIDKNKISNIFNYANYEKIKLIDTRSTVKDIYKFFVEKPFALLTQNEINTNIFSKENYQKKYEEYLVKYNSIMQNYKFNYADKEYFIGQNFTKNQFQINPHSKIEEALALGDILDKIVYLYGVTGSGKTYSIRNFCKKNNIELFETNISSNGDVREAIFGTKQISQDEEGQKISPTYANGVECFRNVVLNKQPSMLFIDEMQRGENGGVATIFNPKEINGKMCFELEGVEEYEVALIENALNQKAIVLITREKMYGIDNNGAILFPADENTTDKEIEWMLKNGNISKVTKKFLKENNYKILHSLGRIKEKFIIPTDMLKIVTASNIGYNYDMAGKPDGALLSRSIVAEVNPLVQTPQEMLQKLKFTETSINAKILPLTPQEEEQKQKFIEKFVKGIFTLVKAGELPLKAYTERNFATLLSINQKPDVIKKEGVLKKASVNDIMKSLINDYLVLNYIDFNIGEEGFELNEEQKELLETLIEDIANNQKEEIKEKYNPDEDLAEAPKIKNRIGL